MLSGLMTDHLRRRLDEAMNMLAEGYVGAAKDHLDGINRAVIQRALGDRVIGWPLLDELKALHDMVAAEEKR